MTLRNRILYVAFLMVGLLLLSQGAAVASVGLNGFRAANLPAGIQLSWETGFEENNLGFHLYRAAENEVESAVRITTNIIPSQSQAGSGASYEYMDSSITTSGTYYYWLEDVDGNGIPGDPDDFHGPVNATFGSGGGLSTPTPRPTDDSSESGAGTPTFTSAPTLTNTPAPGTTPTSTRASPATPTPTDAVQSTPTPGGARATATPPASGAAGTRNGSTGATPTVESVDSSENEDTPAAIGESSEIAAVPAGESSGAAAESAAAAAPESAGVQDGSGASADQREDAMPGGDAATIGDGAESSSADQLNESGSDGRSPAALMLLAAGVVLIAGGGITSFIMLRRP